MKGHEFEPQGGIEAVIFDLDGTLSPQISWRAMTEGLGAPVEQHLKIFNGFLQGEISYNDTKRQLLTLWQSTGNAKRDFLAGLFNQFPIRPEAQTVIEHLKVKISTLCLISGAVDLCVETVARTLGIDHSFTSARLIWDEEGNLVDFEFATNQGQAKLEKLLDFCQAQGIDPQKCLVVGDDTNDLELFIFTGRGVALRSSTSGRIEEHAWKVIDHLEELTGLI